MAVTVSQLTVGSIDGYSDPHASATFSPAANSVLLAHVDVRANTTDTYPVSVSGGGLTWTLCATTLHDTGGTMSRGFLFRATCGSSPGTFAISMDMATYQAGFGLLWRVIEVTDIDTTTDDGQVQVISNTTNDLLDNNVITTFATAANNSNPDDTNPTIAFLGAQRNISDALTVDTGFTELGSNEGPTDNEQIYAQYDLDFTGTAIDHQITDSTGLLGGIAIELEAAGGVQTTGTLNGGGSITAVVAKHTNQIARPTSTITAGDWDTGPTTGQSLDGYTSDASDATWIEDTTA